MNLKLQKSARKGWKASRNEFTNIKIILFERLSGLIQFRSTLQWITSLPSEHFKV